DTRSPTISSPGLSMAKIVAATRRPSGPNTTPLPPPDGPCQRAHSAPVVASHTTIREGCPDHPSATVARRVPSGLKVTRGIHDDGSVAGGRGRGGRSETHTAPCRSPRLGSPNNAVAATRVPSGLRDTSKNPTFSSSRFKSSLPSLSHTVSPPHGFPPAEMADVP